jgi:hypothetical protein
LVTDKDLKDTRRSKGFGRGDCYDFEEEP